MGPVNPGSESSLPTHILPSTAGFISLTENCPSPPDGQHQPRSCLPFLLHTDTDLLLIIL